MILALDPETRQAVEQLAVDMKLTWFRAAGGLQLLVRENALTEEYCAAVAETARDMAVQVDALEQRIAALRAKEAGDV